MNEISQIDLCVLILEKFEKAGYELNARQINKVISSATEIIKEIDKPHVSATPNSGVDAWLSCDETGSSSKFMASRLAFTNHDRNKFSYAVPHDSEDFGRCLGFLLACPKAKNRLDDMSNQSPAWSLLVRDWDAIEAAYNTDRRLATAMIQELIK
jgi:hypothetical protein